jgi:hypothetical protein
MSETFWLLRYLANQRPAKEAPNTQFEQILCPADDGHRRGGRRIGDLSVIVRPPDIKDFTWTWCSDILISQKVLDLFERNNVTGFITRPANVSYSVKTTTPPPVLVELVVTGWGGFAAAEAGVNLARSCPACGYKSYTIAEPSRLIDEAKWDGSDLFIVWPLPRYRFVSDRLASILRRERISGVRLIPSTAIPMEKGNFLTPGKLTNWMPADRARELAERSQLGIESSQMD